MAHHQGMSLLALAYVLLGPADAAPLRRRSACSAPPICCCRNACPKAARRSSRTPPKPARRARASPRRRGDACASSPTPDTPTPEVHLLSNGRYHVMVTNAGGGYSRWRDLAVTRWREDATRDNWGTFCYLRDVDSGAFWSTAYQPTLRAGTQRYEAIFTAGARRIPPPRRRDRDAHRDQRLARRRHRAAAHHAHQPLATRPRTIEVDQLRRSRAGAAGAGRCRIRPSATCSSRPRSSPTRQAILCTRRPRSRRGTAAVDVPPDDGARARPSARRRSKPTARDSSAAAARWPIRRRCDATAPLSGHDGPGARSDRRDPPASSASSRARPCTVDLVTGVAETREAALALIEKYHDPRLADRVFELAWTHSQVVLRQLNATEADAQLYGRLAGSIIYADPRCARDAERACRATAAASRACGATASPATCRSCCCASAIAPSIELVRQARAGARLLAAERACASIW